MSSKKKTILKFLFFLAVVGAIFLFNQWSMAHQYQGFWYYVVAIPAALFLFAGDVLFFGWDNKNSKEEHPKK